MVFFTIKPIKLFINLLKQNNNNVEIVNNFTFIIKL